MAICTDVRIVSLDVLHCVKCTVQKHIEHPLHWIERWTGNYFEKQSLSRLDFVLYLGHTRQQMSPHSRRTVGKSRCIYYCPSQPEFTMYE